MTRRPAALPILATDCNSVDGLSVYEHAVRKLRSLRVQGVSIEERRWYARGLRRILACDLDNLLAAAELPGPIDGTPYLALAELKAKARNPQPVTE